MEQGWLTKTFRGDRVIWGLVTIFMIYSLLAVYSSSVGVAFMKYGGNTTYFLRSQLFMLLLSLVIIVIVHYLPYRIYFSMAGLFLIVAAGLLVLTFAFGSRVNEATRWLVIPGTGFRLQTSDVAKVALVLYLARTLAKYQNELNNFMLVSKYLMFPVAVICGLILPENLSTAVMVFGISINHYVHRKSPGKISSCLCRYGNSGDNTLCSGPYSCYKIQQGSGVERQDRTFCFRYT